MTKEEKQEKEDELLKQLVELHDNPLEDELTQEYTKLVFKSIEDTELVLEWLRITMGQDMKRYFSASTDDERAQTKGAFARTAYIKGKIKEAHSS